MLFALAACTGGRADRAPRETAAAGPLVRALRQGPPLRRPWVARLSVPLTYAPCGPAADAGRAGTGLACAARPGGATLPDHVIAVAGRAATAVRAGGSADAVHAGGLVGLLSGDTAGKSLDRSISFLEMATRLLPSDAAPLADLSAAYLARGAARADSRDVLRAADVAARAIERDPRSEAAHYNYALALGRLGLDGEAARAWRSYLTLDSTSGWADEARRHVALARVPRAAAPDDTGGDSGGLPDTLRALVGPAPGDARAYAWEHLLGGWGEAALPGDSARAAGRLAAAAAVGRVLAREHGDSAIADAVAAVEGARRDRARTRRLADAHRRYARALGRVRADDYAGADSDFVAILSHPPASPVLVDWATLGHGNATIYSGVPDARARAQSIIAPALRRLDERRSAALVARGSWTMGVLLLRDGRLDAGLEHIRRAQPLFERLGDRESLGATIGIEGEALLEAGDDVRGVGGLHHALAELRGYPASDWRHAVLLLLSDAARRAGLDRIATAIADEDIAAADAAGKAVSVVESRLVRARVLWLAGRDSAAQAATDAAVRALATLPAEARQRFAAEAQITVAAGLLGSSPARAHALLDSAVAFFGPRAEPVWLIPALVARAEVALALGRTVEAEADLDSAAAIYDLRQAAIAAWPMRSALLAQARSVFERLVVLRLGAGDVRGALDALEHGRVSFSGYRAGGPAAGRRQGRPVTTLDYALLGDTLLTWVVIGDSVELSRSHVDHAAFERAVEGAGAALRLGAPEDSLRRRLAELYDWLVRPVADRLGDDGAALAIVADGIVAAVPFDALYDGRRGEYLGARYATRWASTLRDARSSGGRGAGAAPARALFVADPVIDRRAFPALPPLPGAAAEVGAVRAHYPDAVVLRGAEADSARVASSLARAELFHFAGHAIFRDDEPERSVLAVRPRGLSAGALASLDLRRLRLVVLSACETMRSPERPTGGFAGLTDAFLAAGAGGVVGTLWPVEDRPAARMMEAFHPAYRRTGDPAAALREARLAALRDSTAALRSPAAWGAFRYAGR